MRESLALDPLTSLSDPIGKRRRLDDFETVAERAKDQRPRGDQGLLAVECCLHRATPPLADLSELENREG